MLPISALASLIDHSVLQPTATLADLEKGCRDGRAAGVASVCVLPYFVGRAAELLVGSPTVPSTVVGFPHGSTSLESKRSEADTALRQGAREIDAVVNVSLVLSGDWAAVRNEIHALAECCHERQAKLKLIFETCHLDRAQKIRLCELCSEAGVDWVKTSTGFGPAGATEEDVRLLRDHCPPSVQVKASGGIRTLEQLIRFRDLGATRIGTSRTASILDEARRKHG